MSEREKNYQDGFRNGRLDAQLGIRLVISQFSNRLGYSAGYEDGQNSFFEYMEKINATVNQV